MIVEWNAHMFSSDRQRYPFFPTAVYTPSEERLATDPVGDYLRRMETVGIDRAVLVQPEPYGDDHRLVLDCLARDPNRLKATCLFLPKDPQAVRKMEALVASEPRIIAQRFHAHRGKEMYLDSFCDAPVRALWRRAGELGLVIELHIGPNYVRQAYDLAREYADYPVLIDHLAEPHLGTEAEYEDVLAMGGLPNVTMKLSGLTHFSREPEPHRDARDLVRRVADAFGPERLAWSSGSPAIVDALLDDWSDEDRARVKGLNLARLAGFV
jgi:predicted TIM-barrel fold metal-dependent hydrolase